VSRDEHDERDFGSILAEFEQGSVAAGQARDPAPGEKVSGTVLSLGEEAVFVDVGAKSDAIVARAELSDDEGNLAVDVGDRVEGLISGYDESSGCLVLRVRPGAGSALGAGGNELAVEEIVQAHRHRIPVEGTVRQVVKGGVEVEVSGLRAFCPVSQLTDSYVENPEAFVGRRLEFRVRSVSSSARGRGPDIVLSRRDLLEEEARRRRQEVLESLAPGNVVRGTVASVAPYGAFVDLGGGVQGLLHVSEMAYERIADPKELVNEGDVLEVEVLTIQTREEQQDPRISLSRKVLLQDPWEAATDRFPTGSTVTGRVMRLEPFGAFVRVAPGLEGLVHVSEMAGDRRIAHPREVVELGQDVTVKVLSVDLVKRRISLSLTAVERAEESRSVAEYEARNEGQERFGSLADAFRKLEE
jgi:small subunit ribosomal protein S1